MNRRDARRHQLGAYRLDLLADQPDHGYLAPPTMRVIGPTYHADGDANHHMTGGAPADWCDLIIHRRRVTSASRITLTRSPSSV